MSASSKDTPIISIVGGLQVGPHDGLNDHPEMDALFQASRQVESILVRERAQMSRVKNDLIALQSRYSRETTQAQQQLKHYAACYEELRKQFQTCQSRLQAMTGHAQQLKQALTVQHSNDEEKFKKLQMELGVAHSSLKHIRHANQVLEQTAAELRADLARAQHELERAQAEVLEKEHQYQSASYGQRTQDKTHTETLRVLKESLRRAQAEADQHKSRWIDAERIKQEAEHREREIAELKAENRALSEQLQAEKRRADQAAEKNRDGYSNPLVSRLAETEEQLSRTAAELAKLQARALAQSENATHQTPSTWPAQFDQLTVTGYPVRRNS